MPQGELAASLLTTAILVIDFINTVLLVICSGLQIHAHSSYLEFTSLMGFRESPIRCS